MRVLMLNRADALSVPGGDTVQMLETRAGLERLGLEVQTASVEELIPDGDFDLVHVFNWEQLEPALNALDGSLSGRPVVLSTIFWFHTGHWFEEAAAFRPLWKGLAGALGRRRAQAVYEMWQQAKFRRGEAGKRLRSNLAKAAMLMPNSQAETGHLEAVLGMEGLLSSRCCVVPNGVKRERYDPLPPPSQTFFDRYGLEGFVIQAARIQAAKNQLGLIEALMDVPVPIVFVGQPSPYEAEYVERCYALGKRRGNVHFIGSVPPEDLPGIYRLAAVHALPSWRETPGLASLEAAATGCRIVTTGIGSARDYFGEDAWYCDPADRPSIRTAVVDALAAQPSSRLRQRVLAEYTWDAAAKATLEAYWTALQNDNL